MVFEAVQSNWQALGYASESLRVDPEVVQAAVSADRRALAATELREEGTVRRALEADGHALVYLTKEQQGERGLVERAVRQDGHAVAYASREMRHDVEIALQAVKEDGITLSLLPKEVRRGARRASTVA